MFRPVKRRDADAGNKKTNNARASCSSIGHESPRSDLGSDADSDELELFPLRKQKKSSKSKTIKQVK